MEDSGAETVSSCCTDIYVAVFVSCCWQCCNWKPTLSAALCFSALELNRICTDDAISMQQVTVRQSVRCKLHFCLCQKVVKRNSILIQRQQTFCNLHLSILWGQRSRNVTLPTVLTCCFYSTCVSRGCSWCVGRELAMTEGRKLDGDGKKGDRRGWVGNKV